MGGVSSNKLHEVRKRKCSWKSKKSRVDGLKFEKVRWV